MKIQKLDLGKLKKITCECGKSAAKSIIKYGNYHVRGWRCACGKEYIHPEDSLKISKLETLKAAKVKVGIVGQSIVIRIPKDFNEIYGLEKGEEIELVPKDLEKIEIRKECEHY